MVMAMAFPMAVMPVLANTVRVRAMAVLLHPRRPLMVMAMALPIAAMPVLANTVRVRAMAVLLHPRHPLIATVMALLITSISAPTSLAQTMVVLYRIRDRVMVAEILIAMAMVSAIIRITARTNP